MEIENIQNSESNLAEEGSETNQFINSMTKGESNILVF